MAIDLVRKTELQFADDEEGIGGDFVLRDGLSWSARQFIEKLSTTQRGVELVNGEPGGGKDLYAVSKSSVLKYAYGRRIILDFKPNRLFGDYLLYGVSEILETVTAIAKARKVEGIEDSDDRKELAEFMQEEIIRWLLEGEGFDIFKGAIYYLSELKKVAYNRNSQSRQNKFIGTLNSVWRHLDLLVMGTHVYENEIDPKAYLQYAKLRTYCRQSLTPDVFVATISRGMYAGPDFVISNVRFRPLVIPINGREPREYLGGHCFYELYQTKHMRF